jgi:hypothetical protein
VEGEGKGACEGRKDALLLEEEWVDLVDPTSLFYHLQL